MIIDIKNGFVSKICSTLDTQFCGDTNLTPYEVDSLCE